MNSALYILIAIFVAFFVFKENPKKGKKRLIAFGCLLLCLESGLRHISVGPDTNTYYFSFMNEVTNSWSTVIGYLFADKSEIRDPAFAVIEKLFYTFIPSWQLFLVANAVLFFYALGRLFIRYIDSCEGVLFAFVLYLALFHIVPMSGIRQQITTSFSLLIIPWITDREWMKAAVVIAVGSTIHISMLFVALFIPLLMLSKQLQKNIFIVSIIAVPLIAISAKDIVAYMTSFLANDYYSQYSQNKNVYNPIMYVVICSLLSIFILSKVNLVLKDRRYDFILPSTILMTLCVPLIFLDGAMIRIGQYFTLYLMVSIPLIFSQLKEKHGLYIMAIVILALYIANNHFEYHFFWENVPGYMY